MKHDKQNEQWQRDINRFERCRQLFHWFTTERGKNILREDMRKIQQRWSKYIKENEVP